MAKVLQCICKSWPCDDLDQVYGKVNMGCPCIWMGKTVKMSFEGKSQQEPRNWQMDRILIILKKENGPRASSAPALGLNTIIFKHVFWYMLQTQVSIYRTIGPLVGFLIMWLNALFVQDDFNENEKFGCNLVNFVKLLLKMIWMKGK